MIRHFPIRFDRTLFAAAGACILAALLACTPTMASDDASDTTAKKAAVDAMQPWLTEIDAGDYATSWTDSAQFFQKAITSEKWVAALNGVRTPLGKLISRKLDTTLLQTIPAGGKMPAGTFAIAQFDSSFENLKAARETVSFQQESDGTWRAVGYYIKPQ